MERAEEAAGNVADVDEQGEVGWGLGEGMSLIE